MTPHEHYLEAERLLTEFDNSSHGGYIITPTVLTRAVVHAQLALYGGPMPPEQEWCECGQPIRLAGPKWVSADPDRYPDECVAHPLTREHWPKEES